VALGLELPPGLVVRTLVDLVDSGVPEPPAASLLGWSAPLEPWLAEPLVRLIRSLDDRAERAVLAPLALREIVFRLLSSPGASVLRGASVVNGERVRIGAAMAFMEENAARRLTVPAVARHLAMSPSHFAHTFREVAGLAPMQYLKQVRLARARSLLLAEGLSAGAVAGRVGYASASHFSRDFKRSFGLAPTRYASAFERRSTAPARESQD
jgi:transcriptional regulator GlxA family with amidase domain